MNNKNLWVIILLASVLGPFHATAQAPFINVTPAGFSNVYFIPTNVYEGCAAWGDYDNDGRLDLLVAAAWQSNGTIESAFQLFHNDGNGQFHLATNFPKALDGTVQWVDYDNDGYLDFMVEAFEVSNSVQLYHNQGNGTFTNVPIPGLVGTNVSSSDWMTSLFSWADYDHDGRPDFAIMTPGNVVQVWHNDGGGSFNLAASLQPSNQHPLGVQWADLDNDGWVDLMTLAFRIRPSPYICSDVIWHNNFTNSALPLFTVAASFTAALTAGTQTPAIADYNNDGLLDFLLFADPSEAAPTEYLEFNTGNYQFTNNGVTLMLGSGVDAGNVGVAGDYDNDGYPDVAVIGPGAEGVYHNNAGGDFTSNSIPGLASGGGPFLAFGDFNNDGRLDLVTASTGNPLQLWENQTEVTNTPPTAPTGLNAVTFSNGVVLSWNAASDAQTPTAGLSYNIYVGTIPGTDNYVGAEANLATGWRRVAQRGMIQGTSYTLTQMPPGTYYWSVQAIDSAFAGGPFGAEGTFDIPGLTVTPAYCDNVTGTSAVLYSSGLTGGNGASAYFQWGLTTSYGNTTAAQAVAQGTSLVPFHQGISGLQPSTYYHFRAVISDSASTLYSPDNLFYTDPTILIGDTNGTGTITATEAGTVLSNYFAGSTVVLTNPATLGGGNFQFGLSDIPGWSFTVQVSTDLVTWSNLPTLATPFYEFNDPQATNAPERYYRLR